MRLIFLGPPGAGKGTQAALVAKKFGLEHISTGAILREAVKKGTPTGESIKDIIENGGLIPDALMSVIVKDKLKELKSGYILDGFPRTMEQVRDFGEFLKSRQEELTCVVYFDVEDSIVLARLAKRGETDRRPDDDPVAVKNRFNIYRAQTQPLIKYYEDEKVLGRVDASGNINEIFDRIINLQLLKKEIK